jgi:hypothetical protein
MKMFKNIEKKYLITQIRFIRNLLYSVYIVCLKTEGNTPV